MIGKEKRTLGEMEVSLHINRAGTQTCKWVGWEQSITMAKLKHCGFFCYSSYSVFIRLLRLNFFNSWRKVWTFLADTQLSGSWFHNFGVREKKQLSQAWFLKVCLGLILSEFPLRLYWCLINSKWEAKSRKHNPYTVLYKNIKSNSALLYSNDLKFSKYRRCL